jgi:CheY-like chemotaxis protein
MVEKQAEQHKEERTPQVIAVVEDLFFGTRIADAAKRAGAGIVFVTTNDAFWQRMEQQPSLIVFDLTCARLDPLALIRELKADTRYAHIPTIGYLPHVREDLRQQATEAGCQQVFPRSLFSSRMDDILAAVLKGQ